MSLDLSTVLLTSAQQEVLRDVDCRVKSHIQDWLIKTKRGFDPARIILETYRSLPSEKIFLDRFFYLLLNVKDEAIINKFFSVHDLGKTFEFIDFAKTRSLKDVSILFDTFKSYKKLPLSLTIDHSWFYFVHKRKLNTFQKNELLKLIEFYKSSLKDKLEKLVLSLEQIKILYDDELTDAILKALKAENFHIDEACFIGDKFLEKSFDDVYPFASSLIDNSITLKQIKKKFEESFVLKEKIWIDVDFDEIYSRISTVSFPIDDFILKKIQSEILLIRTFYENFPKGLDVYAIRGLFKEVLSETLTANEKRLKLFALGILGIKLVYNIVLHPTQVFTVLAYLNFEYGALAQVKTGEGKSMIVALTALIHALEGLNVHVISSSQSLSKRDQGHFEFFFEIFGVSSSHICEHKLTKTQFKSKIIYGSAEDFEFAVMREMIENKQFFIEKKEFLPSKRFDLVIVDEVDNLMIDTTLNSTRIAQPADVVYNWVYVPILKFVIEYPKGDLVSLRVFLATYEKGMFLDRFCAVSESRLKTWLESAKTAVFKMNENVNYIVRTKESGREIVIIDFENTGRVLENCRWSSGIHEFIEVKHGIVPRKESYTPLMLSHPVFFMMYKKIVGMSGTLGSVEDREEIRTIYNLRCFDIPTYLSHQRIDTPMIAISDKTLYLEFIKKSILEKIRVSRPVLVLCETIEFTYEISLILIKEGVDHEVFNEVQKKSDIEILGKAGLTSAVTIATNTAGRGTDIKLSNEAIVAGGLHVLITFYPSSVRVEQQARGRAGRQGQPGSSEIVVLSDKTLKDLDSEHAILAGFQIHRRIINFKFSRKQFELAQDFYMKYAAFLNKKAAIIVKYAIKWTSKRLIKDYIPNLSQLEGKELILAKKAVELMSLLDDDYDGWCLFLDALYHRLACLILNNFAVKTMSVLDGIVHLGSHQTLAIIHTLFNCVGFSQKMIERLMDETSLEICSKMDEVMEKVSSADNWGNYIKEDGSGLEYFLKELLAGKNPKIMSYL